MKRTALSLLLAAICFLSSFAQETCPNNEIWYTSEDGIVVEPKSKTHFNAAIVSNTYSDGKGIIAFDSDLTSVGESAFSGCSRLTSITLPHSVTTIGYRAFYRCSGFISFTFPHSLTSIEGNAFNGCSCLISVTIPSSVQSIGDQAFLNCNQVKTLIYEEGTQEILHTGLKSIETVVIPNSAIRIGNNAFFSCVNLTSITIPNSVTSIGELAFSGCENLTSLTIPYSVESIEYEAFMGCYKLTDLYVENPNPPSLSGQENALKNAIIHIPVGSFGAYSTAEGWKDCPNLVEDIPHALPQSGDKHVKVYATGNTLVVSGVKPHETIYVYSSDGKLTDSCLGDGKFTVEKGRIYLVKVGKETFKVGI